MKRLTQAGKFWFGYFGTVAGFVLIGVLLAYRG